MRGSTTINWINVMGLGKELHRSNRVTVKVIVRNREELPIIWGETMKKLRLGRQVGMYCEPW